MFSVNNQSMVWIIKFTWFIEFKFITSTSTWYTYSRHEYHILKSGYSTRYYVIVTSQRFALWYEFKVRCRKNVSHARRFSQQRNLQAVPRKVWSRVQTLKTPQGADRHRAETKTVKPPSGMQSRSWPDTRTSVGIVRGPFLRERRTVMADELASSTQLR